MVRIILKQELTTETQLQANLALNFRLIFYGLSQETIAIRIFYLIRCVALQNIFQRPALVQKELSLEALLPLTLMALVMAVGGQLITPQ